MARFETLFLFWVLLFNPQASSQLAGGELFFEGFKSAGGNITVDGAAAVEKNGVLRLTNDTLRVLGHAFFRSPVRIRNATGGEALSFSTAFAFAIIPEYPRLGGHGLAFTLSPTRGFPGALPSQYLGILNSSDLGNSSNHVIAVEFDTVQDFEFGDVNDNHVGVDVNSLTSNCSAPAAFFAPAKETLNLKSGKVIQAWIDYDSEKKHLHVSLSPSSTKPNSPILSCDIDLSPIIGDFMFIGFSSSTGLLASTHYILGWSFKINGEAKSLSLNSLPRFRQPQKTRTAIIIGSSVSAVLALFLAAGLCFYIVRRVKNADVIEAWELEIGPHRFSYSELEKATKGFRDRELIGSGGFGKVYKGILQNSKSKSEIAVKRISHESKQGLREFASEIASIGRLRHRNLVPLLGWCRRRADLLLVYDFMPNGSLDKYIFENPKSILSWETRFKIIKNVALGVLYLHEEWDQAVVHRDIKAGNVLLDGDLTGRLGDFGLAKLHEHGSNPGTTRVVGTLGYLAPELTRTGKPTASSDVFAFGALLLEVVCGRRPVDPKVAAEEELVLVDWVWRKWAEGAVLAVADRRLCGEFDENEVVLVVKLGLMCSNGSPERRPAMRQVVRYLEGEAALPEVVAPPERKSRGGGAEFEDFVHSYPASSYFEKVSVSSSVAGDDVEAELPLSGNGDGR